jgi:hypothetical protein
MPSTKVQPKPISAMLIDPENTPKTGWAFTGVCGLVTS